MKQKLMFGVIGFLLFSVVCKADEGMWIPMLLEKYNIEDMRKKGFRLTAEDIYNINQASLKDAVIGLGTESAPFHHFCTGEFVSKEGLVFTNHHCAYSMTQAHSTLEHNYLRDGFWAGKREDELTNPGITASILVWMEDVTEYINSRLTDTMNDQDRSIKISRLCRELENKAVVETNLKANVKSYFGGNQFFMSVYKIYKDVRLVGVPPSTIGKFGGDTDNWVWPRHTGDFSLLRIYAGADNEPAAYSENNRPYTPASCFKISTKGIKENDFAMVFGYPASSMEYLPSFAIEHLMNVENPHKIAIRTTKLNIINSAMSSDELLRIKYSAKAASVANGWKKWQGEIKGLKRYSVIENKRKIEADFITWATDKPKYSGIVEKYKTLYQKREMLNFANIYATEAGLRGSDIVMFALRLHQQLIKFDGSNTQRESLLEEVEHFYKDFDLNTDKRILAELLKLYTTKVAKEWQPEEITIAGNNVENYINQAYTTSIYTNLSQLTTFIRKMKKGISTKLNKDPIYRLAFSINTFNNEKIVSKLRLVNSEINSLNRLWLDGLMEMMPERKFYADANSTLRVSYGVVGGYAPADAVKYNHFTTLSGIMEKDNPEIYDYNVPQKLRDLYKQKDFGVYAENGDVPVCFIANNHTSGGNSGSPVLNADGHLIGINFDRAWDGVMSDSYYSPDICRNISLDIRYALFIIDKFASAGHLLKEMDIE